MPMTLSFRLFVPLCRTCLFCKQLDSVLKLVINMNKFRTDFYKTMTRHFAAARVNLRECKPGPSKQKKGDYGPMEIQRSTLLNGIKVASAKPLGSQMGSCTIMFNAGSRYEMDDQIGVNHFLRVASTGSGCAYTAFAKMKVLQQSGAYITCTSDRETIAYTLRCVPHLFAELKYYLLDTATRCCFHKWELPEWKHHVKQDLARIHPEVRVMDLVQRACWAGSLSQSVFCEYGRIDKMRSGYIQDFVAHNFRTHSCAIGSLGLPFEHILKLAEKIDVRQDATPRISKRLRPRAGFETYDLGACSDTWIAVCVPSCGTRKLGTLLKYAIVASSCGTGVNQVGQHAHDRTPQPPLSLMAKEGEHTSYKAFNLCYRDKGIFGILAKTTADNAHNAALSASEFLAHVGDLDFDQIEAGKQRLRLAMCLSADNVTRCSEGLALQAGNGIEIDSSRDAVALIDCLASEEISLIAQKISNRRDQMAVAVVGDVSTVPSDCEIMEALHIR